MAAPKESKLEIQYRGLMAKILFSHEAASFYGEVLNSDILIAFHASSVLEAVEAMQTAVDQYWDSLQPLNQSHLLCTVQSVK